MTRSPRPAPAVIAAHRYCETVTALEARNFSYGIRLLPGPGRHAMSALYAFSRRVDDIGDGPLPPEAKEARLKECRILLERIRAGEITEDCTDPVALALADAVRTFPIPVDALDELIDGVLMDVHGRRYHTWDDLRDYCRCVAGAVGRLSLGVFGTVPGVPDADRAVQRANTLGLALQLTNILRDLREDARNGRSYLPAEELRRFGCQEGFRAAVPPAGGDFTGLMRFQVRRARELFADGLRLLPLLDRRSGACVAAMAGIYHRLLDHIAADPAAVLRGRVSLPPAQKALVAVRGLTGLDTRRAARGCTA
ncbi:presqualene diphosphate synthase HpnD [Streptomyces alkaliphilus]|uniref:Presqualene diphosphate synthase HpnD n=1 Tax=Streptomyces alkaliphilus TaxID=1472722 RepID=A0A7W3Y471_9ACTN|nr:presqualene diphosphate synthase HpnD [Streptomyces alkaliphilus]MBB0247135.1 presqualene diphosphate synthase HpnD [Streptomyces alkaliphilus]MQS10209.1 presqualene diphosphate synthase HpnD [Streptomyces alkaliphilus]